MSDRHWTPGCLNRIETSTLPDVREVDQHTHSVHLANHLPSKSRETGVLRLVTAAPNEGLVVIGELDDPHT